MRHLQAKLFNLFEYKKYYIFIFFTISAIRCIYLITIYILN